MQITGSHIPTWRMSTKFVTRNDGYTCVYVCVSASSPAALLLPTTTFPRTIPAANLCNHLCICQQPTLLTGVIYLIVAMLKTIDELEQITVSLIFCFWLGWTTNFAPTDVATNCLLIYVVFVFCSFFFWFFFFKGKQRERACNKWWCNKNEAEAGQRYGQWPMTNVVDQAAWLAVVDAAAAVVHV